MQAKRGDASFGREFGVALAGSLLGCLATAVLCTVFGIGVLLLIPPFGIVLALAAPLAAILVATASRLSGRRHATSTILLAAAILTMLLFAALPLYLATNGNGREGGFLF